MGQVTVVTSGKGGAGKSTVTAGLGCALARLGRKVLLVDADAGLRSLDLLLGIGGAAVYDIADVFAGNCEPIRAIYPSPICSGVFVAPAPVSLEQLCAPEDMRLLCRGFSRYYDDVIIDCPAGVGQGFRTAVAGAEAALVVTTPDMVCARDAQIVSRLLSEGEVPARLIINRLRALPVMKGRMPDVDEIIDTAGLQLLGILMRTKRWPWPTPTDGRFPQTATLPCALKISPGAAWGSPCRWPAWKKCSLFRL